MDSDILRDVPVDKQFIFQDGTKVSNIYELVKEIRECDELIFRYHVNKTKDDFANWVGGVLADIWLSKKLRMIHRKDEYVSCIERRILFLEKQSSQRTLFGYLFERMTLFFSEHSDFLVKIFLIILVCLLSITSVLQWQSIDKLQILSEHVQYVEDKNACYNQYYTDRFLETETFAQSVQHSNLTCETFVTSKPSDYDLENTPSRIRVNDITVTDSGVSFVVSNARLALLANSSSMLPTFNHNTKAIEIKPTSATQLAIGDVISYELSNGDVVIHRIVETGVDSSGFYVITKGDNNNIVDSQKVRFEQITGVVVALIY